MIEIECCRRNDNPNAWGVEEIRHPPDGDGQIYVAIFSGPDAENRAEKYADWCRDFEWSPIETAPKDGTVIWLYGTTETSPHARPHVECESIEPGYWVHVVHGWAHSYLESYIVEPTHWMPIPKSPKEAGSSGSVGPVPVNTEGP